MKLNMLHQMVNGFGRLSRRVMLLVLFSCVIWTATSDAQRLPPPRSQQVQDGLNVMTANAYIGADLAPALALNPADADFEQKLVATITEIFGKVVASDPPARMAGLAREIVRARPHLVGLEEMDILSQAPMTATGPGEFTTVFDWAALLLQALHAQGADYQIVSSATHAVITMPMMDLVSGQLAFAQMTDRDIILARSDVSPARMQLSNPQDGNFAHNLTIPPPINLELLRGWCSIDVNTPTTSFRLICTHLEEETMPQLQELQAAELLSGPANTLLPVMIVGDLNADPLHRNLTTVYDTFIQAGFKDAWAVVFPHRLSAGLTWGHDADLSDPSHPFVWRIDHILYRGGTMVARSVQVLDQHLQRGTPPLWPSDHAAVDAQFEPRKPGTIPPRGRGGR